MKKIILFATISIVLSTIFAFTISTTVLPYFVDASKKIQLSHYNGNDKYAGYSSFDYKSKTGEILTIEETAFGTKGDKLTVVNYTVEKKNGATAYDMNIMIGSDLDFIKDRKLTVDENTFMEFPDEVKVGDILKDGVFKGVVYSSGSRFAALDISCINRKVVEKAELETPAGKFESYCVEFTLITKIGIIKSTDIKRFWFNNQMGIIKTDRHSKNGKYTGKSVLSKLL
jgi:hypothetical protein